MLRLRLKTDRQTGEAILSGDIQVRMPQVRCYLRLGGDGMLRLSSLRLRRFLLREKCMRYIFKEIISLLVQVETEGQAQCAERRLAHPSRLVIFRQTFLRARCDSGDS